MADYDVSALETKYGIPAGLYSAIVNQGENSGVNAVSPKGAMGPAQLMPATAAALNVDPNDPAQNLEGGAKLTGQLWAKYQDPSLVAAAYNAGEPAVDHHGGVPPYRETQAYVKRVTGAMGGDPGSDSAMPSPGDVLGGYKGSQPASGGPAPAAAAPAPAPSAPAGDSDLPSPADVLNGFGSAKSGSGSVVFSDTGAPVNAAQEATARQLFAQGKFDPNAKPGDPGYVVAEGPGLQAPAGMAHIAEDGTFVPGAPTANTSQDVAKSAASGVLGGFAGIADQLTPTAALEGGAGVGQALVNAIRPKGSAPVNITNGMNAIMPATNMQNVQSAGLDYQPQTTAGKYAKSIGQMVPNAILPEGAATRVLSVVAPGVASEAAGQGAEALGLPKWAQTGARVAGGVVGGGIGAIGPDLVTSAAAGTKNALLKAAAPYLARSSQSAAEAQAGARLASAATDLPAVRASLANGPVEIVPGSTPTTFQQTADPGLGALERGVQTNNPKAASDVRGAQNAARVASLDTIQSGADPLDVAKHLKSVYDDVDTTTDAAVKAAQAGGDANVASVDAATGQQVADATGAAQGAGAAIGGTGTPEGYGADLRTAAIDAEAAAKGRERALWTAVDPDGTLTGNVAATKTAAQQIVSEIPAAAKPMSGEESGIFQAAADLPKVAPVNELIALRSRVSAEMRQQQLPNGDPQALRRLTQLRGAIQDNLSGTISDKVASDQAAVSAGQMAPEEAVGARLQADRDAFLQQRQTQARAGDGSGLGNNGAGGSRAVPGAVGAEVPAGGGSGNAPGGQGLSGEPQQPTFNADAGQRLAVATEATKQRAQTYRQQPVASLLAKNGGADQFRLPNGAVPAKVFHPGARGFDDVTAYLKATGPDAAPAVSEYAASSLRRSAVNADGTLDPARFARWQAQHADALRALPPEVSQRFATAASAGQALGDAGVARAAALKEAQANAAASVVEATAKRTASLKAAASGPSGKIMTRTEPEDVTRAVATVLGSNTSVADMKALAAATRTNPDAYAGLRQSVLDHITGKYIGNTEAGTSGTDLIKADGFQTFLKEKRPALAQVLNRNELGRLDAIAADIKRSKLSENALKIPGTPGTAQDLRASAGAASGPKSRSMLDTLGGVLGGMVGHHMAGTMGSAMGIATGGAAADFLQQLRSAGISRVDQLVTKAVFDPAVAKALLERVPANAGKGTVKILRPKVAALVAALSGAHASRSVDAGRQNAIMRPVPAHLTISRPNALLPAH